MRVSSCFSLLSSILLLTRHVLATKNRSYIMELKKREKYTPRSSGTFMEQSLEAGTQAVDLKSIYTDVQYVGVINVGTPAVAFEMILDTGSADIWFPSVPCQCGQHSLFHPQNSTTFAPMNETWSLQYLDGSYVQGVNGKDVIRIGDLTHAQQTIGLATLESRSFADNENIDGVFGLAFPSVSFTQQETSIVLDMYTAGEIDQPVVGMYLGRTQQGGHGEAIFGGVNPDHYTGDLVYLPVTEQRYWTVDFGGIDIDGQTYASTANEAILDTGTTLAVIPRQLARVIHEAIPGGKYVDDYGWFFPCDTNTTMTVTFKLGGHDFTMPAKNLLRDRSLAHDPLFCITGLGESDSDMAIMGETFLRYFYSAYNFKDAVVGLAPSHP